MAKKKKKLRGQYIERVKGGETGKVTYTFNLDIEDLAKAQGLANDNVRSLQQQMQFLIKNSVKD